MRPHACRSHGVVEEVTLFKDRRSGRSKGCGFVSMASHQDAAAALLALDGKCPLVRRPGGGRSGVRVPSAWAQHTTWWGAACRVAGRSMPCAARLLAVRGFPPCTQASAPRWAVHAEAGQQLTHMHARFAPHRAARRSRSRCSGPTRSCSSSGGARQRTATQTIAWCGVRHARLVACGHACVRACRLGLQRRPPQASQPQHTPPAPRPVPHRNPPPQLFFAKVVRTASEPEVRQLFSRFGRICEVNLFRAFQVAGTCKRPLMRPGRPAGAARAGVGWPGASGRLLCPARSRCAVRREGQASRGQRIRARAQAQSRARM